MKILFLQDHARSGGAARAAGRWAELLRARGHATPEVVGDESVASGYHLTGKPPRGWARLREVLTDGRKRREETVRQEFLKILQREKPDLVWCHNLAGGQKWGWGEFLVTMAREHRPVLWTLHDMWALADGSASYWDEDPGVEGGRWKGAEGREQGSRIERVCGDDGTFPVTLTAPSKWLAELTKGRTGKDCLPLPNPIDLDVYRPGSREHTRERLGLPQGALVVLAGADSLQDRRKGFDLLRTAWARLSRRKGLLVLFGRHGISEPGIRHLGPIDSDAKMIDAYQAADLYVHPARIENASCQIQEAMACGIPALGFATGGNPELIRPGKSGLLASRVDAESLANELERAMELGPGLAAMGGEARKQAQTIWEPDRLIRIWEEKLGPTLSGR